MSDPTGWVHVNGRTIPAAEAGVSVLDHGLLYGDGLFETLGVHAGRLFRVADHLSRLRRGAAQLRIDVPWTDAVLEQALRETLAANGMERGALRLTVTRGAGPPVPDPSRCGPPSLLITGRVAGTAPATPVSVTVGARHPRLFVPAVKSLCYLPFQLARQAARARGFDDVLLTWEGELVEASSSNLFLLCDGVLVTPRLESGCLDGIMRAMVLEIAAELGIPCREGTLPAALAESAEELFLTNSVSAVVPVARVDGRALPEPGAVTTAIAERLLERIATTAT